MINLKTLNQLVSANVSCDFCEKMNIHHELYRTIFDPEEYSEVRKYTLYTYNIFTTVRFCNEDCRNLWLLRANSI